MPLWILFVAILFPVFGGVGINFFRNKSDSWKNRYVFAITLITGIMIIFILMNTGSFEDSTKTLKVLQFTGTLSVAFRIDGFGAVFSCLIAVLWPLAVLYSFEYMEHEQRKDTFNMFYVVTFGVTLGIAWAANLFTMYLFFELLTLVTTPLVIHELTHEANRAGRKYLAYCIGGASFGFIALVFMLVYGNGADFIYGGCLDADSIKGNTDLFNMLLTVYLMGFFGFGVKAAVFPLHSWLPSAYVAPTPVTALLHAVAVVKAGAFAVIRLTYYCYGIDFLKGTWAQNVAMAAAIITIVYASSMAVRQQHIKKRLAYSTVSNLSYILFGVTMMSPLGFMAALTHMVFHAIMKICSFFCAGAVMHCSGKSYVSELEGMGRKMPKTFICFTIASFALVGTPPLCGFMSKWNLARAAIDMGGMAYVGLGALFLSALLVAIYMLSIVVRAFFPREGAIQYESKDPGVCMLLPLYVFVIMIVGFGVYSSPLMCFFEQVTGIR